jgi:glycyl-tRNA synthetase beta subunit
MSTLMFIPHIHTHTHTHTHTHILDAKLWSQAEQEFTKCVERELNRRGLTRRSDGIFATPRCVCVVVGRSVCV